MTHALVFQGGPPARTLCTAPARSGTDRVCWVSRALLCSMKRRGVSFLEMLAMEMKAEGKYVARGLSFR